MFIPDWMANGNDQSSIAATARTGSFLNNTLRDMNRVLVEHMLCEKYASREGLWQSLDPRVKLVSAIAFILTAGLTRSLAVLAAIWIAVLMIMKASRLPVGKIQGRVWAVFPLLTFIAGLPAVLNIFIPGQCLVHLWSLANPTEILGIVIPAEICVTRQGLLALLFLVVRVGVSISAGLLLVLTTPAMDLWRSLQLLKVPGFFIMILDMTYRYLGVFLTTALEMFEARALRTVGQLSHRSKWDMVGSSMGVLFAKSVSLADEVFMAMAARGYTGEAVALKRFAITSLDMIWLAVILLFLAGLWYGGLYFG